MSTTEIDANAKRIAVSKASVVSSAQSFRGTGGDEGVENGNGISKMMAENINYYLVCSKVTWQNITRKLLFGADETWSKLGGFIILSPIHN